MELEFSSHPIEYLRQVLHADACQEETMDAIIPDTSPDVERIITVAAVPVLRGKECRSGSVTVSGGIRCSVLYQAEGEQFPRFLEVYMPYSIRADGPQITEDARVIFCPWIRSAEARVVNSRKLNVRVELCGSLRAYEQVSETVPVLSDPPAGLQLLQESYLLSVPVETAERSFRLTEELQFPQNRPLSGEIVYYEPRLELTEKRIAGNKAVFKGLVHFSMLYESQEQKLSVLSAELPFSQYCELGELYEDEDPEIVLAVTGSEADRTTRQEGDGILLTVHILAQCVVSSHRTLSVCRDAYCLDGCLMPRWQEMEISACLDRQNFTRTVRESWQGNVAEIICAWPYLDQPFAQRAECNAELVSNGAVKVLYRDTAGQLQEGCIRMAIRENLPSAPEVSLCLGADISGAPAVLPVSGGMELRCSVHLTAVSTGGDTYRTLCGGSIQPVPQEGRRPSVILRRTGSGERLWDIAKENGTTVERIRRANRMDADETETGILLIPT